ncbi:transporter substrate-binding domain-containing protein [Pseudomonas plecoglossicida]|uniref:transporter substrate-binding domain-containing protein n=1 Tax=Pseudomonas plecoglossicida TaxID=70775 RepID=UPI0015E3C92A|nr:transporter substrate-binding domain-containing protein [Pseudomonas plecoglossicida]MBA1197002.1 transporter substrate-binding domain-containing protein [Pseudomonas plecoglossicida]
MRSCLIALLFFGHISAALADAEILRLLGRSSVVDYQVALDEADWSWLRQKGKLVLGASEPDYPPFDMSTNRHDFEGLTADYAALLGSLLHLNVEVRRYDSRSEVIAALKKGEVDLLVAANSFEAADSQLLLSSPYAADYPVLVTRSSSRESLSPDLAGKQVAMLYHYLPPEMVRAAYPEAHLRLYPSALSAIGAVAFGRADVYLGDSISANYLINKNYLNNVQLTDFTRLEVNSFAFAAVRENVRLLRLVNAALKVIPASEKITILHRWGAGGASISGQSSLHFSNSEQRWLEKHPRLKVAINENYLPLSFINARGEFRGISADVLNKISLRTGLKFDVVRADSVSELTELITSGKADLLASITSSDERRGELRFLRPYLTTPFVLVTRVDKDSPNTLDDMAGKKLALIHGNVQRQFIIENFPHIELISVANAAEAMALVAGGKVDGAVNSLISASYMISRQYISQLQVKSTIGNQSARISFAINRGSLELHSILDKALLSISPDEMDALTNRWRSEVVINDSYWERYRSVIVPVFIAAIVLFLLGIAWITYLRDLVRRREEAERALNDQMEFMRVLIDGTPHPIYVCDRTGRLMLCNSAYLEVLGVVREEVIGKTIVEGGLSTQKVEAQTYHDDCMEVMDEGTVRIQDRALTLSQGPALTIYHWMLPYRGSDGEVAGLISGWIDISDRQHLLEQLREAKDDAEDANRAKTTFLATMSHEIRTPMNAVIGMLELAMKKADQGVMDRFSIEVASGAALGLLELIGDILDIARIESGRLSLSEERANLRVLVASVARIFEGLARQKRVQLVLDLDFKSNRDVLIDPLRFKQIVSNLLSNAIKFTSEGEVRLSVQVSSDTDEERLAIRLLIEDTGSGISVADQQRLFRPFSQASNSNQSARGGSGLGLVISRTLCEMMGGQLTLSSVLGEGTRVEASLDFPILDPLPMAETPVIEKVVQTQILNILVVDDYQANRLLLSQQLSYLGHRVSDAKDGAHGLLAWRKQHFDVVITDCNMPVMNGYALSKAIREEEQAQSLAPCLLLGFTANAQPEEKERCLQAGMDDCLFKPISLKELGARLESVTSGSELLPIKSEVPAPWDGIDLNSLEQLTLGDRESIKNLLNDLASSNEQDMTRLFELFAKNDLPGLADLAHRVKGGARIVKAHSLIFCCEQLEKVCRELDREGLTQSVDALQKAMERLAETLELHCA